MTICKYRQKVKLIPLKALFYAQNIKISNWAVNTRINIVSGYTVEYATAGASLFAVLFAYANAGGSVVLPLINPIRVQ